MVFLNGMSVRMRTQTSGTVINSVMDTLDTAKYRVFNKTS
jgi:hypothetical protein